MTGGLARCWLPLSWLLSLTALTVLSPPLARAQSDTEIAALTKRLDEAAANFNESKQKARASALTGFDRLAGQIKNGKGSATTKTDKITEITNAKKEFADSGAFPADGEYAQLQMRYYLDINKSYRPLARLQDELLDIALKTNDDKLRDTVREKKKALDAELPGSSSFAMGSHWTGTLALTTGSTDKLNLRVEKRTGSVFRAHVIDKPSTANHPEYLAEGTLDGLAVKFKLNKVIQGSTIVATFTGILAGNRLLGTLDQATNKGKRMTGFVTLSLGK